MDLITFKYLGIYTFWEAFFMTWHLIPSNKFRSLIASNFLKPNNRLNIFRFQQGVFKLGCRIYNV